MERLNDRTTLYSPNEAKELFKILRKKGIIVDKGRATGNLWSKDHKQNLAWMERDFQGNWAVEMLIID
jgi:hypothetical protein